MKRFTEKSNGLWFLSQRLCWVSHKRCTRLNACSSKKFRYQSLGYIKSAMSWHFLHKNCQFLAFSRLESPKIWVSIQEVAKFDLCLTKFAKWHTLAQVRLPGSIALARLDVRKSRPLEAAPPQVLVLWRDLSMEGPPCENTQRIF